MPRHAYHLEQPERVASCVVFASPHSGSDYPDGFLRQTILNAHTIRSSEDAFVDRLFQAAPQFGAPFLHAGAPRAFVDFNRSPDELDPALIRGALKQGHNPRVASGLGVIPRVVAGGRAIYRGKIAMEEARRRISDYWVPYHTRLQGLLSDAHARFGRAILIDCHSMPREAVQGVTRGRGGHPDIVLGDRFGAACDREIIDRIEAAFAAAGLVVARNSPFAGAYVTQAYGRPSRNQHAVQVEIDRSLYMDEAAITPNAGFDDFVALMQQVTAEITALGYEERQLAAE